VAIPPVAPAALAAPCPTGPASGGARFGARLEARLPAPARPPEPNHPAARLAEALRSLEGAQARLDRVLEAARAGRTFSAGELLALQADAYRFTQTFDVAGKLVEHGVQSVKQAVNAPA
jgi:hypothetical protein